MSLVGDTLLTSFSYPPDVSDTSELVSVHGTLPYRKVSIDEIISERKFYRVLSYVLEQKESTIRGELERNKKLCESLGS